MFRKRTAALAVAGALGAATLGYVGAEYFPLQKANAAPAVTAATAAPVAVQPGRSLPDFTGLVESQGPAVVHISVAQRTAGAGATRDQMPMPDAQPMPRQGQGSGFIITPDGYILTNAHVVADASELTVKLTDKREFKAKVIGADARTDVAVVKIEAANLPTVRLGDPSKLKVGEWVAAIGSPFGL